MDIVSMKVSGLSGYELQVGDTVPACRALIRTVHHEGFYAVGDCGEGEWREPWDEEVRCGRPVHDDDAHDRDAVPVVWRDPSDTAIVPGKTYYLRGRHHGEDGSLWSRPTPIHVSDPPTN